MPFCCIAIVGIALIYFTLLWLRHLFSGPRRDRSSSLPVPPRALTGNGAVPVYGHSWPFSKAGGDLALLFPPDMHEVRWLPKFCSRPLGDCFSLFLWGQWRVVIRGPEVTQRVLDSVGLREGWAWSPPKALLGNSCLPLLKESEAEFLGSLIQKPLSHESIARFAPEFADLAESFMNDLQAGKFQKHIDEGEHDEKSSEFEISDEEMGSWQGESKSHKIKWNSLRSYTLSLIDGPLLNLKMWENAERIEQSEKILGEQDKEEKRVTRSTKYSSKKGIPPSRDLMMLWMERVKAGLTVVKVTWGARWAQVWRMNEYGRAVNGRMHIGKILSRHVEKQQKMIPIPREMGRTLNEPMAMPFPWITIAENIYFNHKKSQITSSKAKLVNPNRMRTQSAPEVLQDRHEKMSSTAPPPPPPANMRPLDTEQDLHHAAYISSPRTSPRGVSLDEAISSELDGSSKGKEKQRATENSKKERKKVVSLLEQLLQQKDSDGTGMTQAVMTEICFLLWMMMDVGNAWTAMSLHLLASDEVACKHVQQELDHLVNVYGKGNIYVPSVMKKMVALDAVLHEAIRLCPPFLGGLKKTSQTFELPELGVQVPKNTNVVFCQPTKDPFNLAKALGEQPQELGMQYPCLELHGFLPFQGMEVPLMVLQSKVFVAVLMQRCSPFLSKKRTFIRKVKDTITKCAPHTKKGEKDSLDTVLVDEGFTEGSGDDAHDTVAEEEDFSLRALPSEMTQTEAMRLFSKIPFPEPRRVINVQRRHGLS